MRRVAIILALILSCTALRAQDVVCDTFHYATTDNADLYLDRYMVMEGGDARPCMIFAFGGGFVQGVRNHEYYARYFDSLARAGIVVVSIDYRLGLRNVQKVKGIRGMIDVMTRAVDIAVEDMYTATDYVIANAEAWGVDTTKIMISGSSAGAITAVQAEWKRCNGAKAAEVLPEDFRYAAVVSCAGAIYSTNGKPRFKTEPAPMLLFHGSSDSNVPYNKSSIFGIGFYGSNYIARQLDKIGAPYHFYSAEYVDHSMAGTPLWYQCELIKQFISDYVIEKRRLQQHTTMSDLEGEKRPTRFTPRDYLRTNYKRR